ncbi:MAG: saccharopine dehydrogenase NADP-binding domain-containing protein [Bacillota bacterium]
MKSFGFMVHPLETSDITRKYEIAKKLPERMVERLFRLLPPLKASHITGIKSPYAEAEGWFVGCTLTSHQMLALPTEYVIKRIINTGKLAQKLGAQILGLGAMTSVVGDAGITVAKNLDIPVTTGNSYTVATALEGAREAARLMDIDMAQAEVVIIGATGSIGAVCTQLMAKEAKYLTLVARDETKLDRLAAKVLSEYGLAVNVTRDVHRALKKADLVITVTSAVESIIHPEDLKPGSVVCDVARPRDVSRQVVELRDDVLVIGGGVVEVPGDVQFNLNFGYPPKVALACMAETIILTLEGRFENFTLGRDLTIEQVEEISRLARKHGFKLAGFRSFERPVTLEQIQTIKDKARSKKKIAQA